MNAKAGQDKGRVVWIESNKHVCVNISASADHPFWLPVAIEVSREEFVKVTETSVFQDLYFSLGLACVWGTPTSRQRAAKALGRHFQKQYVRPSPQVALGTEFHDRSVA